MCVAIVLAIVAAIVALAIAEENFRDLLWNIGARRRRRAVVVADSAGWRRRRHLLAAAAVGAVVANRAYLELAAHPAIVAVSVVREVKGLIVRAVPRLRRALLETDVAANLDGTGGARRSEQQERGGGA